MLKNRNSRIFYFITALAVGGSMVLANFTPAAASEYVEYDVYASDEEESFEESGETYDGSGESYDGSGETYDESGETYDESDGIYDESGETYDETYDDADASYDGSYGDDGQEYYDAENTGDTQSDGGEAYYDGENPEDGEDPEDGENPEDAEDPEDGENPEDETDPDDPDEDEVLGVIDNDDPIETEIDEEFEAESAHTLVYMSDLDPAYASIGWGSLMTDENPENGEISLRVNGAVTGFKKGVAAHAESTLIYNVADLYALGYRYFQTYYGVNSTKAGSVIFHMYTTTDEYWDGAEWTAVEGVDSSVKSGSSAAGYIEIPLTEDMTYIKLYADPDGGNGQDHSVYGGAKFITDAYYHDDVMTVAEYDEKIKEYYSQYGTDLWSDSEYEQLVLERDLVNKVGYDVLQSRFNDEDGESYKEMIEWLFDNPSFLKMYLTGDQPGGNYLAGTYSYSGSSYDSYSSSLETMFKLWKTHREDFDDTSNNNVYRKMICAVSLSITGSVKFWYGTSGGTADTSITQPDPVERYEIYKRMYQGGYLLTSYFDQLYVPEMRYIMGSSIHNNEIEWGANMALERNYNTNCYSWMYYQYGTFNYFQDKFYNSETWGSDPTYDYVSKYNLSTYGITNYGYGSTTDVKYPMNWMGMVDGGTCWPIANLCQNIWSSYGRPCYICGCWGGTHEVYMAYNWYSGSDNSGRSGYGRWTVENGLGVAWQDVNYGAYDSTGWHIARLLCGWGTNSDSRYTNASYVILGQSAMNDYNNYVKAEELEMLSRVFSDDEATQESIYWAMLSWEGFHYDAWRSLVKLYASSKSDEEKYGLAEKMMAKSALYYYPIPLDDLLSLLTNSMSSSTYISMIQNSEQETLRAASQTTDAEFYSAYAVQEVAKGLLGTGDSVIGSFSFDGENAGQIILDQEKFPHPEYWEYSLDGGNTWSEVIHDAEVHDAEGLEGIEGITTFSQMVVENTNVVQLTPEEIAQVNTNDNILIRFIQVPDYWYTIYITQSGTPVIGSTTNVTGVYLNPWENSAVYVTDNMQWRNAGDESSAWTSFASAQPDRYENPVIDVRYTASGTTTAGDYITLSYENSDNNYKEEEGYHYIPISHLELYDYTSQTSSTRDIKYALDGSIYSFYQSVTTTDYPIYITLKLDTPAYLDKLEYQCNLGNTANGQIKQARVLVSMDGENWTEAEYLEGTDGYTNYAGGASEYLTWGTGNSASGKTPKQVYFAPVEAQYIRLEAYSCEANFMSVGELRVYAAEALTDAEVYADEEEAGGTAGDEETGTAGDEEAGTVGGTLGVEEAGTADGTLGDEEIGTAVGTPGDEETGTVGGTPADEEAGTVGGTPEDEEAGTTGGTTDDEEAGTTGGTPEDEEAVGTPSDTETGTESDDGHVDTGKLDIVVETGDGDDLSGSGYIDSGEIGGMLYSIRYEQTDEGIRVTIEADQVLQALEGWDRADDGQSLTRVYLADAEAETVIFTDEDGNSYEIEINVALLGAEEESGESAEDGDSGETVIGSETADGSEAADGSETAVGSGNGTTGDGVTGNISDVSGGSVTGTVTDADSDSSPTDAAGVSGVRTGDTNLPMVLLLVIIICAAVIVIVLVWIRTGRRNRK